MKVFADKGSEFVALPLKRADKCLTVPAEVVNSPIAFFGASKGCHRSSDTTTFKEDNGSKALLWN